METKTENKYKDIIIAYEGEGDYGKYIKLTVVEDCQFKKGDKVYLNANKFKNGNDKAPDYKYSVKNEQTAGETVKPVKDDELPF